LNTDFTGDFEVIARWAHDFIGTGVIYGPGVTYADANGYSADANGPYFGALNTSGFPSAYAGSYVGLYSINGTSTAQQWLRWSRAGTQVNVQHSTVGQSGPWTDVTGSPFTIPATDTVVVGVGEASANEPSPLQLISCVQ